MNKTQTFLRKYWLFILLAAIATTLAIFYFISKSSSPIKKTNLLSLTPPEIKTFSVITFSSDELEKNYPPFSQEIEVYQVDETLINDQQAIKIAQNFGYNENPQVTNYLQGQIYNWSNNQDRLAIYIQGGTIQYTSNQILNKNEPPSLLEAENRLKEFLNEKELIPSEKITTEVKEKDFYFTDGSDFIKTTSVNSQKNFTFLKLVYKINNLIIDGPEQPSISIYFANNFQIVRFNFSKIFNEVNADSLYPIKTKDEIIKSIKENPRISFLKDISGFYEENLILEEKVPELKSLSFDKIELIYYKSINKQTSLQPVFLITGKAILKDGTQAEAGLYLPAIKDEYLLK